MLKGYILISLMFIILGVPIWVFTRTKNTEDEEFTEEEKELLAELDFNKEVFQVLKDGFHSKMYVLEPGKETQIAAKGIYFTLKDNVSAYEKVSVVRDEIKKLGYIIFISDLGESNQPHIICVIKGNEKYDALRFMGTNGINYGHDTNDVIDKLREWDEAYGVQIISTGFDFVEIELECLPENIKHFAEEIYQYCPDSVEQGLGTVEELEEYIIVTSKVYMWWD